MTIFKASAHIRIVQEELQCILPHASFSQALDSNGYPILKISVGSDWCFLKIDSVGNASRIDALGISQAAYSPHQAISLQDSRSAQESTLTISDWETGETVTASLNGIPGTPVPFNTDNNTSVSDLATQLLADFPQQIASATPSAGVITIVGKPGMSLSFTQSTAGGDSISFAQADQYRPEFDMREKAKWAAAKLGMKEFIYAVDPIPASYSLTNAILISTIPSDKTNPLTLSQ